MTFEEAIKRSIKSYYENGDDDLEYNKGNKERVYNKSYFDSFEEEILASKNREEGQNDSKPNTKKTVKEENRSF